MKHSAKNIRALLENKKITDDEKDLIMQLALMDTHQNPEIFKTNLQVLSPVAQVAYYDVMAELAGPPITLNSPYESQEPQMKHPRLASEDELHQHDREKQRGWYTSNQDTANLKTNDDKDKPLSERISLRDSSRSRH